VGSGLLLRTFGWPCVKRLRSVISAERQSAAGSCSPRLEYNVTGNGEVRAEIVGVTGNVCVNSISDCEVEHIYLPESQNALRMAYILIRSSGDPLSIASAVKRAAVEESPLIPLDPPQTLEQRSGYLTADVRQGMWLISVFAGLAVLLAASGVYGVSTYLANLRRKEMGNSGRTWVQRWPTSPVLFTARH
jgi:hypothetical protein